MANRSQRFGAVRPDGARSGEWVVAWKDTSSDVYIFHRSIGRSTRASIHQSGRCNVHWSSSEQQVSPGTPRFLDTWLIDPSAPYAYPFAVVFPGSELRGGEWRQHRDRGTVWLHVDDGDTIQVGIFLIRSEEDQSNALAAAGWHTTLVHERLTDGRRLLVVAGRAPPMPWFKDTVRRIREQSAPNLAANPVPSPRVTIFTTEANGPRRFIEAAPTTEAPETVG